MSDPQSQPPTIAVAGCSTGIGHAILTALLALPPDEKHVGNIIALTRHTGSTPSSPFPLSTLTSPSSRHETLQIRPVDYDSIPSLTGVHTLLSCIVSATDFATPQLNLLAAARAAGEFATPGMDAVALYAGKRTVWAECVRASKETRLQVARFRCGVLMEGLGVGCPIERLEEALAGLTRPFGFVYDVEGMRKEIPGDGTAELTFTRAGDVGRGVAAACCLPHGEWEGEMGVVGETVRMVDVVGMVERVRGREMEVRFVGVEELEGRVRSLKGVMDEKEGDYGAVMGHFHAEASLATAKGGGTVKGLLNEKAGVRGMRVEEYLARFLGAG